MSANLKELISYSQSLNVLFIEDNEEVRLQLLKLLQNFFVNIDVVPDGLSALNKYNEYYEENNSFYDLVITDLSMPKMDGVELSKHIIHKNSNQIIVVISAHTETNKLLKLIDIGIYKFLQKPVDYRDLLNSLSSIISKIKREKSYLELENEIKEIKSNNLLLSELAITDKLTSINNRRFIDNELAKKFKQLEINPKNDFAIIFTDIDDFKLINDEHGHLIGDEVLIEFANILKSTIRANDIVGRWGGEEFIILCDRTNSTSAKIVAQKLREVIENNEFAKVGKLTASFGIASYENIDTISSLIEKADYNLYRAKESGKNRVVSSI